MQSERWSRRALLQMGAALPFLPAGCAHPLAEASAWALPPEQAFEVIEHIWAPMPDGVRLSVRLWLPADAHTNPAPAVFEYIPYRKRDAYRMIDSIWGATLAARGIAFARIDVRGSGESEGVLVDEYAEQEISDGVACIAWLADQPWCNGSVGMRGISWGGINTLMIAARKPPALKAIMPMGCTANSYSDDAHFIGGALGHTNFQWGAMFKGVMAGPPDPEIVGPNWEEMWRARLAATPNILTEWLSHQRFDDYWRRRTLNPADIDVPTYLVSGWQDTYAKPVLHLLESLDCPRKCLIGPWGHTYPWAAQPHGLEWALEEVRWWTHWLKNVDTGIMDGPMLRAFMGYSAPSQVLPYATPGRWIAERAWPANGQPLALHLNADGLSTRAGPIAQVTHEGGAVVGLAKPEWLDRPPVEQSPDDARSLCFDSVTLESDIEILGAPALAVRVAANVRVAQLAVRVTEVTAEGQSWLVSYGLLNLTRRDGDANPMPLEPGRAYDVRIELFPIAHRFKQGSKIRVALSDGLWPLVWPSPEVADLTFELGSHSRLELPVRPTEREPIDLGIGEIMTPPESVERPSAILTPVSPGHYVIDNDSPPYEHTIADTGVQVSRGSWERSEIVEGQPSQCRWTQRVATTWRRDDWSCALEASYELTATTQAFSLSETLIAKSGDTEIFRRTHISDIARDLL